MARAAVTASAGAAISTHKTFHNRRVHPHHDSRQTLRTGILYAVTPSPCLLSSLLKLSLHFRAPRILRMCLKSTLHFEIYIIWLKTERRKDYPVLQRIIFPSCCWCCLALSTATQGVAVRTAVYSRGKGARKKNATIAANLFWRPVVNQTSCPTTTEVYRTYPTNRPRLF